MALKKYECPVFAKPIALFDISPRGLILTSDGIAKAADLVKGFDRITRAELYWDDADPRIVVVPTAATSPSTFVVKKSSATSKMTIPIAKLLDFVAVPPANVVAGPQVLTRDDEVCGISFPVSIRDARHRFHLAISGGAHHKGGSIKQPPRKWLTLKDRYGKVYYAHPTTKALLFYREGPGRGRPDKDTEDRILAAIRSIDIQDNHFKHFSWG